MSAVTAAPATLIFPAEGYGDLPPGWLAEAVTFLEMREPPSRLPVAPPEGVTLDRIAGADLARYRRLFAAVGEDWLWFGRRRLDDAALAAILDDPAVWCRAVVRDGRDVGLVELDRRIAGEVEIAYFGLTRAAIGGGLGRAAMTLALDEAWSGRPDRVWLHTCHFDHPGALAFYRRSGFTPYKFALEFGPDPRLIGLLPRDCAPHVPLIDPTR